MDIEDAFWNIVKYIPMKYILQLQLLSKQHREWIYNMPYCIRQKTIKLSRSIFKLESIILKYQLANINLRNSDIYDNDLKILKNCVTINLYGCYNLTDDCTTYIPTCKSLFLSYKCGMNTLKHLTNIQDLYLSGCKLIDDNCIQYISHCRRLDISATQVTEKSLPYLINCYGLAMGQIHITNYNLIRYLRCQIIDLSNTNVDDSVIQYLTNRKIVNLAHTKITNSKLNLLNNCQAVNVSDNVLYNVIQQNIYSTTVDRIHFCNQKCNLPNKFLELFYASMYGIYLNDVIQQ